MLLLTACLLSSGDSKSGSSGGPPGTKSDVLSLFHDYTKKLYLAPLWPEWGIEQDA
jgi:hypothetical protein